MKRLITTFVIAACAALAFSSCEILDPDKDFSGTPYGFWVVDKLVVDASLTINGNTTSTTNTTDFTSDYCRLNIDTSGLASLWYNLDLGTGFILYDGSTNRITFKGDGIHAGDDGKAIILLGIYDVELNGDNMVLSQPDFSLGGSTYGASEKATYYLHRAPKKEKPKETTQQ